MTNLLFFHEQLLHQRFLESDLGLLYVAIPFERLAKHIPSISKAILPFKSNQGLQPLPQRPNFGGLSDEMLIDRIQLKPHEQIRDKNLPSSWRVI
jgi:hypothetical protein